MTESRRDGTCKCPLPDSVASEERAALLSVVFGVLAAAKFSDTPLPKSPAPSPLNLCHQRVSGKDP